MLSPSPPPAAAALTPSAPAAAPPRLAAPAPPVGLDIAEAARILAARGPNELHRVRGVGVGSVLVSALANPLVLVLLAASVVAAFVGEAIDAGIIVVMVLLSAALNVVQTYRSGRAAERLRQSVAPTATVLRDGAWREIPRREVVPGDIIRLVAGDLVPADALLLEGRDLHVQQAALTGESLPVEKEPGAAPAAPDPAARSLVFLGTSVVSGTATARVLATGCATAYGEIAARLGARLRRPSSSAAWRASVF